MQLFFFSLYAILFPMPFEGTALRRRPQRFEDLIGQDFVAATLQKSIEARKIAHAYLFAGPRGCGKTTSARILAKALNCETGPTAKPCGDCTACAEIAKGASLDVIEIDGASNTSVNDVRQIKDEILFPPNACKYKIYIIDEVHMLSTSAFNALLKTIEEPPPYVIFVFATTELHKVPATIKSRCQQFNFRLVPVELLKEALEQAAAESGIEAESEALYWIARQGNGSVRDSYMLFDQVASFSDGHITFAKIQDKLKIAGFDEVNAIVEACAKKEAGAALSMLDNIFNAGISAEQIISDFAEYFRNLLFIKAGITKEAILGQRLERFSQEVLKAWGINQAEKALEIMLNLYRDARYSLDTRCELELSIARLCWLSDYVSPEDLKKAFLAARDIIAKGGILLEQKGKPLLATPAAEPFPPIEQASSLNKEEAAIETEKPHTEISGNDNAADVKRPVALHELPKALSEYFLHTKAMISALFSQTENWEKNGKDISFSIGKLLSFKQLESEKSEIQNAIRELLGENVTLSIKMEKSAESVLETMLPPEVETVCSVFKGSIFKQTATLQQDFSEQQIEDDEDTEEL